jgi:hypothetical protein
MYERRTPDSDWSIYEVNEPIASIGTTLGSNLKVNIKQPILGASVFL